MNVTITGMRRFIGLGVHADTISAVVAEREAAVRDLETIPNREESVRKLSEKLTRVVRGRLAMRMDPRATRCTGN